jgi:hypothetical protein
VLARTQNHKNLPTIGKPSPEFQREMPKDALTVLPPPAGSMRPPVPPTCACTAPPLITRSAKVWISPSLLGTEPWIWSPSLPTEAPYHEQIKSPHALKTNHEYPYNDRDPSRGYTH